MKSAKELSESMKFGENLYQGETKQEKQSTLSPEKAALIQRGMEKLLSYGLLNDPHAVRDWANGLVDLDEYQLLEGFKKAKDYTGYMSLGDFRKLCAKPTGNASFREFKALPIKPLEKEELKSRIAKMRAEFDL